jgi:hypothetical protein
LPFLYHKSNSITYVDGVVLRRSVVKMVGVFLRLKMSPTIGVIAIKGPDRQQVMDSGFAGSSGTL